MAGSGKIKWMSRLRGAIAAAAFGLMFASTVSAHSAAAPGFKTLHKFLGGADGEFPEAGLTVDVVNDTGRLYGTTFGSLSGDAFIKNCAKGCQYSYVNGSLTVDHVFTAGSDGAFPTGEVAVRKGVIYGTTEYGGHTACGGLGCGTAFRLSKGKETVFYFCTFDFPLCNQGALPRAGLILDDNGNAYGTTTLGGTGTGLECDSNFQGCGTVYMLTPDLQETVLYNFCSLPKCRDGAIPLGRLWRDVIGDLYGTTQFGGKYGAGTIFKLTPDGVETVLYSFCPDGATHCNPQGSVPEAGVVIDGEGNLYGTASAGGGGACQGSSPGCGVVFKLAPDGTYTPLHVFAGGSDGELPQAPVVPDSAGNLYGTTLKGGGGQYCAKTVGCGTVFKLASDGTYGILYVFGQTSQSKPDGTQPEGALLWKKGYLYGATRNYGDKVCQCGTLFKLSTSTGAPGRVLAGASTAPRQANGRTQSERNQPQRNFAARSH